MTELGEHQLKAIREMHNGCIVTGGVGTGKTRTALVYFFTHVAKGMVRLNGVGDHEAPKNPTDLYVITTAKKRDDLDWEKEKVMMGLVDVAMTVDSWNNIGKYEDRKDAFFIFDEQRLVGSGAWVKSFYKIAKSNGWIILSATPGDTWMDYAPVFVANGFFPNKTAFQREHVVYKNYVKFPVVERYVGTKQLERLRDSILVDMPYERHTTRHEFYINVKFDQALYDRIFKQRWDIYNEKPLKDISGTFAALRRLVNTDVSRLGAVLELMEKHPRLIVFYNHDPELMLLRTLGSMGFNVAEWNGHKHQDVPTGEKWIYLVQYTAGAEGWNCIETNAIVFFSLNYSYKVNEQSKGRIDRLNTPFHDLYYYLLLSDSPLDSGIRRVLGTKQDFNERSFMDSRSKTHN